jgi:aldose sugar dehydrogenase
MLIVVIIAVIVMFISLLPYLIKDEIYFGYAQEGHKPGLSLENKDNTDQVPLVIERIFTLPDSSNLFLGPNIAFLGQDDILAMDGVSGKVWRITNGNMSDEPLIDVNSHHHDGLIGITTAKNQNGSTYVFLYFNEAPLKYGADVEDTKESEKLNRRIGYDREGDRLYRYELVGNKLVHPKLLFNIPDKTPNVFAEMHHGGEVIIGPDNALYMTIGQIAGDQDPDSRTKAQNYKKGTEPDGRAGILRLTQDGTAVDDGILGNEYPLNLYYAYGIRNSFGMDFDPLTGNLWDTENGPNYGDEINLVKPGFNSGWNKVQGFWEPDGGKKGKRELHPHNLVDFDEKGVYGAPEFVWDFTVGPTALKFFNSDNFGKAYKNDMFVADFNNGNIYHFDLNENRTALKLDGPLKDKIADSKDELRNIVFAHGFFGIVDLQIGPDGYLYVVSDKSIFRIRPLNN